MGNNSSRRHRVSAPSATTYPHLPVLYYPQVPVYPPPSGPAPFTPYPQAYPAPSFPIPPQFRHNGPAGPQFYPPMIYPDSVHYQYAYPTASGYWANSGGHIFSHPASLPEPLPPLEKQTITIRNDVNIQKGTIHLEKDVDHQGFYLLAFTFDADSAGSFSIFLFAKEGPDCSLESLRTDVYKPVPIPFEKGLGQKFCQAPGTGLWLDTVNARELEKEGSDDVFPLTVRAETYPKEVALDSASPGKSAGDPLPKSVSSQITQAVILKKHEAGYDVKVLRQIIWVNGVRYELQEIYGIEGAINGNEYDGNDFGKECVICMTEPRDTAVMPCRHMCMCDVCATVLRSKMNRCPICRQYVQALLKIKV